jgi:hypothetical protein
MIRLCAQRVKSESNRRLDGLFRPLTSWPGSSRPSTRRRVKESFDVAMPREELQNETSPFAECVCDAFDKHTHVDGRDEPGHDAR